MKIDSFFHMRAIRRNGSAALLAALLLLVAAIPLRVSGEGMLPQARPGKARRALIISIDGLDARYLNRRDQFGLKIPTLSRLMTEGARAQGVVSVSPSVTYPAHATIVTGARPLRHGIYGNEMLEAPATARYREWYWFARYIRAETLWDAARQRGLKVGLVSWPVGVGAGDYSLAEILKFGGTLEDTLQRIKENSTPRGIIEEIERRDPRLYAQANRDEQDDMRTRMAEYIIREKRPDLVLIHLLDLDHFEHEKGPFTPEAFAMLEKSDAYVGRILEAARQAGTLDETAVFIVSDHGFLPITKQFQPGVLLERAGLVKVREERDEKGRPYTVVTEWRALPFITNGSCAIILRDERDREALRKVRAIFRPLAGRKDSGIAAIVEGSRLRAIGASPRAALMLDGADGYSFGANYAGDVVTGNPQRGAHGYLPNRPDYYASFIAAGAGIGAGQQLGVVQMTDIGPTIARALGLNLKNAEGRALRLR